METVIKYNLKYIDPSLMEKHYDDPKVLEDASFQSAEEDLALCDHLLKGSAKEISSDDLDDKYCFATIDLAPLIALNDNTMIAEKLVSLENELKVRQEMLDSFKKSFTGCSESETKIQGMRIQVVEKLIEYFRKK
jgi:hypothetical protein